MFRCLDTGLDNSRQCLKTKKDMVRIDGNEMSISTREHIVIQDSHVEFIQGILFNSTWTLHKGNSFETSLVQISNG